jgi:hypothetical protein
MPTLFFVCKDINNRTAMDNTEEIQKLVGKLVIESHLNNTQLQNQIRDLLVENNQLKERLVKENVDGKT